MATKTLNPATAGTVAWLSDASWLPTGVPGAADDVVLAAGNAVSLSGAASVSTVAINPGALLDIAAGSTLSASNGITLNGGTLSLEGLLSGTTLHILSGSVTGTGVLSNVTIDGTDTLTAGSTLHLLVNTRFSNPNEAGISATAASTTIDLPTAIATTVTNGASSQVVVAATIDGGLLVAGSANAGAPTQFVLHSSSLVFGTQSFLAVAGQAEFDSAGADDGSVGHFANQGTILIGAGARLKLNTGLYNTGTIHIASGTLDASASASYGGTGNIAFDDGGGTALIINNGPYNFTGFRAGDTIDLGGLPPGVISAASFTESATGTTLVSGGLSVSLGGISPTAHYTIASDGAGGTLLTTDAQGPAPATYAVTPSNTAGIFTVTRNGDTSGAAVLTYGVSGTGSSPAIAADFLGNVLPTGVVTFATGETSKTITLPSSGVHPTADQSYVLAVSGAGTATGTVAGVPPVTPPLTPPANPAPYGVIGFVDGTTGASGTTPLAAPGAGGPSYLQGQYIYAGADSLALATQQASVFVHAGSGNDAIQVSSGQNVLDGGLGSNFLTGGSGQDTFFTDARQPGVVWNTVINFHSGDAVTLWGYTAGVSSYYWENSPAGAAGAQGATLRANIVGGTGRTGDGIDASITFAGLSVAQGKALQVVTGTQPAGSYLFLVAP